VSLLLHAAAVARCLRIDVHDNNNDNDNVWHRGPLWPHRMGPIKAAAVLGCLLLSSQKCFCAVCYNQLYCLLFRFYVFAFQHWFDVYHSLIPGLIGLYCYSSFCGSEWPMLYWCASNKLLSHWLLTVLVDIEGLVAWHSGSIVHRMNKVTLHWAWLVLGWMTIFGDYITSLCNQAN